MAKLVAARVSRRFHYPPERVFDAWIDPKIACHWLFTSPMSETHDTKLDPRIGGKWTIIDRRGGIDYTAIGEYLEIERPHRLVFSFSMPQFSPEFGRVIVEIVPEGEGCILTLTQESVPETDEAGIVEGWNLMFKGLTAVLTPHGAPGEVVEPGTIRFERLLPGPVERVWEFLADSDKRSKWLAWGELEPKVGSEFTLRFHHAELSANQAPVPEKWKAIKNGHVSNHRITRFEPPRVLAFSWGDGVDGASEVTFELTSLSSDWTLLVLTHRRLADRAAMVGTAGGWHSHLRMLADRVAGTEPPAFWVVHMENDGFYDRIFPDGDDR
jgi:uncharacterized protein YndB with AHSA1/START domain